MNRRTLSAGGGLVVARTISSFAAVASLVLVGWLVMESSAGVFTSTTANTGSSFSVGTVDLVDDDAAAAIFSVADMGPGDSAQDCITVTYQGTIVNPGAVRMYTGGYTDTGTLDTFLNVVIEEGTGGTFGDCTGFAVDNIIETGGTLSAFDAAHTNYATGAGVWDPVGTPDSVVYRVTVTLDAAVPNAQQGEAVTALGFTWETQS